MNKLIAFLLTLSALAGQAQYRQPFFNKLTVANGLPEGFVVASLQDKEGYIWMGTQNGLVRYDGYTLKTYDMSDDNGKPLNFCNVRFLYEDAAGTLWADVMFEGEYYYDRQKDAFNKVHFTGKNKWIWAYTPFTPIADQPGMHWSSFFDGKSMGIELLDTSRHTVETFGTTGKGRYYVPTYQSVGLNKDANGHIWVTADTVLSLYDPLKKTFTPYFVLPSKEGVIFNDIYKDPRDSKILWFTVVKKKDTATCFAIRFNTRNKAYKIFPPGKNGITTQDGTCTGIFADSLKRLWFATTKSLLLYDRQTEEFTSYPIKYPGMPGNAQVYVEAVAADGNTLLWFGGNFLSLGCINLQTRSVTYYGDEEGQPGSLPNPRAGINNIFLDKSGILWVSVPYEGMAYLDPQNSFFNPMVLRPPAGRTTKNDKTSNYIEGVKNDSTLFVAGTSGFFTWNFRQNTFSRIDLPDSLAERDIRKVFIDTRGLYWILSWNVGLYCFNPATKKVTRYVTNANDSSTISSNAIRSIVEGSDGRIWVGTFGGGVCSFNRETGKFTRYPFIVNTGNDTAANSLDDDQVETMAFDKDGYLWIGTNNGGLNRLDVKTGQFTSYHNRKDGLECVDAIYQDSRGRLWAGTYLSGLFLFDAHTGAYKRFTERDGLAYNGTYSNGITEDKNGNIWILSQRGFSIINAKTGTITAIKGALASTEGVIGALFRDSTGEFYVQMPNKVVIFDPLNYAKNHIPPNVVIEQVKYHIAGNGEKDTVLFASGRQEIQLRYNQNRVTFGYVALQFADAAQNNYAYKLDGYDKDWVQGGTQRTVTYTNLSPGKYTFHVKAANADGVWSTKDDSITIVISPPWWKTWWAYLLYAIIAVIAVWAFVAYRSKALKQHNKILEHKVQLRTAEVLEQKEELAAQRDHLEETLENLQSTQAQLIQSEKMASLGELTAGIAHEIQNPLNFVNNFSDVNREMIGEMKEEINNGNYEEVKLIANNIEDNEEKINHHGKRADAIVKNMLQHSRQTKGVKEPTDINALCDEYLRLSYHGLRAKDKSFNATIETDFDQTIGNINVVPQDIGRVLLNLFNNAFYAVNEQKSKNLIAYEPTVSVGTKKIDNKVEIKVKDNGNGIPQKVIDKIFQPFFTTKPTGSGTGLGLSLSYDIIKAHGGAIKVESKEGEGTEFIIQISVNN